MSLYTRLNMKVKPDVNCRLWMMKICQCRFIVIIYVPLFGDVDNGGGFGGQSYIKIPVLSFHCCGEPKIDLRK